MTSQFDPVKFNPEDCKDEDREFTSEEKKEIERRFAIDKLSTDVNADYDIAKFVYNEFGILDEDIVRVKLSTEICSMFLRRSLYWSNKSRSKEEWENERYQTRSSNIFTISKKLKTNKYKNIIIQEYKSIVKYNATQSAAV